LTKAGNGECGINRYIIKSERLIMKIRKVLSGLLVLMLAFSIVALAACAGASPLVGKWQFVEEEGYFIEFFNDGQMEMGSEDLTFVCAWEETGEKEITLTLISINGEEAEEEPVVLEYSISGDELTLDDGDSATIFSREK
jgi:hypothetical protein